MTASALIQKWLNRSEIAAAIGLLGLLILSVATFADVIMRGVFNNPIYGLSDLVEIVTPPVVASCFPVALAARQNITIRFLGRALDARGGQTIELFGQIVTLLVLIGIVWRVGGLALVVPDHAAAGRLSPDPVPGGAGNLREPAAGQSADVRSPRARRRA